MTFNRGSFLAIADRKNAIRAYPEADQIAPGSQCTSLTQCQIVFVGAPLIAVAFNLRIDLGISLQPVRRVFQFPLCGRLEGGAVIIEVYRLKLAACFCKEQISCNSPSSMSPILPSPNIDSSSPYPGVVSIVTPSASGNAGFTAALRAQPARHIKIIRKNIQSTTL